MFALIPESCALSEEAANTNLIVLGLTRLGIEPKIYSKASMLTITPTMGLTRFFEAKWITFFFRISPSKLDFNRQSRHFHVWHVAKILLKNARQLESRFWRGKQIWASQDNFFTIIAQQREPIVLKRSQNQKFSI